MDTQLITRRLQQPATRASPPGDLDEAEDLWATLADIHVQVEDGDRPFLLWLTARNAFMHPEMAVGS